MTAIYKISNIINGKFYVGSTVDTRVRFQTHRRQLRKGTHHCAPLQHSWNKHGEAVFRFDVVEQVETREGLFDAENRWLEAHHGKSHCYNVSKHADAPTRGMKFSDEHKAKISDSNMGNQSALGHKHTAEHCEAIRQRKIGNKNFLGKTHTPEARALISETHKGKQHRLGKTNSPEHRARQSASMRGIKKSPEHVEKIRQRMIGTSYAKGRVMTDEQKAVMGRAVVEVTTGLEFITVAAAAEHFGISRPNLVRALRIDGKFTRGPNKGLHFQPLHPTPV